MDFQTIYRSMKENVRFSIFWDMIQNMTSLSMGSTFSFSIQKSEYIIFYKGHDLWSGII